MHTHKFRLKAYLIALLSQMKNPWKRWSSHALSIKHLIGLFTRLEVHAQKESCFGENGKVPICSSAHLASLPRMLHVFRQTPRFMKETERIQ